MIQTLLLSLMLTADVVTGTRDYSAPLIAPRIDIIGDGFNGTDVTGPILRFAVNVNGISLGKGDPFRATGTRIERLRITRNGTGGTGINLTALDAGQRPGEIVIRDVLVCGWSDLAGGNVKDNWECGLRIDGGPLVETNKAGIRRIRIDNLRVASCLGDSIILRNVTHLTGTAIQIDQGTANRVPTMIVENSRHVDLQVNVFGELHIRGCDVVTVRGYVQTLRVDKASRNVIVAADVGKYVPERGGNYVNTWGMVVVK